MSYDILWNSDEVEVAEHVNVPVWIDQGISCYDVAAIVQGGCESGAYMPAVTYYEAQKIINEHADSVIRFLENQGHEKAEFNFSNQTWAGFCVQLLSLAVDTWAYSIAEELAEALEAEQEDEECS